jgi:apolipoprotein D and lipocalin family protein
MKRLFILALAVSTLVACTPNPLPNTGLNTVPSVDLSRYTGTWYEVASIPQFFSLGCHNTTATYTAQDNGIIKVENKCRLGAFNGPLNYISGKAKAVDNTNAKLNVTFVNTFGPGSNYWIIELASDYSYSVVSDPSQNTLFILSRTPRMSNVILEDIFERLEMMGFDVSKIAMTPQNG